MREKVKGLTFRLFGATMLALLAIAILRPWGVTNAAEIIYEPVYNQTEARSMLEQINEFRKSNAAWYWNSDNETKTYCTDLQDLVYDYELEKVAMQRAAEIAINWDHTRPDGRTPWTAYDDLGYERFYSAENIAAGQTSASAVFTAWREDNDNYSGQGHRRNMLNSDMKAIGIACVTVNGIKYWVQEFAGNTPTGTETAAVDTAVMTKVQVSDSDITFVSCQNEEVSINVGESISIPELFASVKFSGAWPEGKLFSVRIPGVFDTADNEYVSISDGTVVGLKAGTGTITGMFLGQSVSLTVNVTGNSDPDHEIVYVGDVDGDKQITPKDVTVMRRALAGGWGVTVDVADGDVDGDKQITPKDVTLLRRYLAGGWGVKLPEKTNQNSVTGIAIDQNNFPDENFRNYVLDNIDINNDELLSDEERNITYINCFGNGINDLTGIEYFTELQTLNCCNNELTSLDVSSNTKLQQLYCGNNTITSLIIGNNDVLFDLSCYNNQFVDLDVSLNTGLRTLDCSNNMNLVNLNLGSNSNIIILWCDHTQIEELNIDNCSGLIELCEKGEFSEDDAVCYLTYEAEYERHRLVWDKNTKLLLEIAKVSIIAQPEDVSLDENVTAIFDLSAEGYNISYRWEYQNEGASEWNLWSYGKNSQIKVSYLNSRNGRKYRCIVFDIFGNTVTSNEVLLQYENPVEEGRPSPVVMDENLSLNELVMSLPNDDDLYDPNGTYYYFYRQLTPVQKVLYWKIENMLCKTDTLEINGVSEKMDEDLNRALYAQGYDNPLFEIYLYYGIVESELQGDKYSAKISKEKTYSERSYKDTLANADKILEAIPNGQDRYTLLKNLMTIMCTNIKYDAETAMFVYYPDIPEAYNMVGCFIYREAVCQGMSASVKYLCDKLGIPCLNISGTYAGTGHSWNYVRMEDDNWYFIDLANTFYEEHEPSGFLKGIEEANYNYPYMEETYSNMEYPKVSDNSYLYDGNYQYIEEIVVEVTTTSTEDKFEFMVNDDGETCTVTGYIGKQVGDLVIPSTIDDYKVTKIGRLAFYHMHGFTGNIIIPDGVVEIEEGAFLKCSGISGRIMMPDSLEVIGDLAFAFCPNITGMLDFPSGLKSIGRCVFYRDESISGELILPDELVELGESAFAFCTNISGRFYIPDGITFDMHTILYTDISEFAISESSAKYEIIDGVLYDKERKALIACPLTKTGTLEVASGTLEIDESACDGCSLLTTLVLNPELKKIRDRAFFKCNFEGGLVLPDSLEYIGSGAFENIFDSTPEGFVGDLIIPDSVIYIGPDAFVGNVFGGTLRLPNNLTEISDSLFMYCSFSGDLFIPDSVEKVGSYAFCKGGNGYMFTEGDRLTLSKNLVEIGEHAFSDAGLSGNIDVTGIIVGENAFKGNFFESFICD